MEVENKGLKKSRQTSAFPVSRRRALNEIGNVVGQNVSATVCLVVSKGHSTPLKLRRSTRLSSRIALPTLQTRKEDQAKETPCAQPRPKVRLMGPPMVPAVSNRSQFARKSKGIGRRAPRLTMKPPDVETPPEEREAARKLIEQDLAAERNAKVGSETSFSTESQLTADFHGITTGHSTWPKVSNQGSSFSSTLCQAILEKNQVNKIPSKDDIDLAHRRCFWMVSVYSKRLYAYLQKVDRKMASKMESRQLQSVSETTRNKLVEWMASAHLHLNILQETFQLSVSILDRYLLRVRCVQEVKLELVAVTCLSLGIKYEEILTNSVKELLSLSSRLYTMRDYVEMEAEVLRELGFQIARPVSLVFLRRYSTAAKCDRTQHSYGKFLIDLSQMDFDLARLPTSSIAAAAAFIVITLRAGQLDPEIWKPVMLHYTTLTFTNIKPIVSRMAALVLPGGPQCRPLKRKYSSEMSYFSADEVQQLLLALHEPNMSCKKHCYQPLKQVDSF